MFQGHVGSYGAADIQPSELMSCHMEDDQQGVRMPRPVRKRLVREPGAQKALQHLSLVETQTHTHTYLSNLTCLLHKWSSILIYHCQL